MLDLGCDACVQGTTLHSLAQSTVHTSKSRTFLVEHASRMAQHTVLSRLVRWVGSYTFAADSLRSAEIRWDPLGPKSAANPLQIRCKSARFADWDRSARIRWDSLGPVAKS